MSIPARVLASERSVPSRHNGMMGLCFFFHPPYSSGRDGEVASGDALRCVIACQPCRKSYSGSRPECRPNGS